MTIRSRMSLIMGVIGPGHLELFVLELKQLLYLTLLHCSINKYQTITSKLGQNIYDSKISDKFDHGYNQTRTVEVICP